MPGATPGDVRVNATLPQDTTIVLAIISTVGLHTARFAPGPTTPPSDCRNPVEQRHELRRIVAVSAVRMTFSGVPLPSTTRSRLLPALRRSVGLGPVFPPMHGTR
jgi:hypothetical protein